MKNAKRSEVPLEYRRNRKERILNLLLMAAICMGTVTSIIFMLIFLT